MSESCGNIDNEINMKMDKIFEKYVSDKSNLIQILNETQETFGYIPNLCQSRISQFLEIPMAEVYGVITFYSRFTLKPKGKYNVSVCMGTACFVKGSETLLDRVKSKLGIEVGETTLDGKFSIDATRCVGACGLAPVFMVNEEVHGKANVEKVDKVLEEYMNKEN